MEPSQVSGPGQEEGTEIGPRFVVQALTLFPGPKPHLVVLTAWHHPYAGAEPQLSAWFNSEFINLQPPTLSALQPKKLVRQFVSLQYPTEAQPMARHG